MKTKSRNPGAAWHRHMASSYGKSITSRTAPLERARLSGAEEAHRYSWEKSEQLGMSNPKKRHSAKSYGAGTSLVSLAAFIGLIWYFGNKK